MQKAVAQIIFEQIKFKGPVYTYPHSQAPPSFLSLTVQKSSGGPGIIYHMSDVEGREKVERT